MKNKLKYILEFTLTILTIPFWFLPVILISLVILLSGDFPIFFKQKRLGKNGKIFRIIKFRTMIQNAEQIGSGLFTDEKDPRITRIGSFLRKTSLDELPQLFNVLKGDMGLVGPRPPATYYPYKYEDYSSESKKRFLVRPGMTGLAQVRFRNEADWDTKIKADLEYVNNMSLWLDIKILFITFFKVFKQDSIYGKGSTGK